MGEDVAARSEEIKALQLGLDLGAGLIDTAETYGEGRAEELVGEAIDGRRDEAFLVSKVGNLVNFARKSGMTATQVALAWLLSSDDVIVIPKTSSRLRLRENIRACDHKLTRAQLEDSDRLFPPPTHPQPLEML